MPEPNACINRATTGDAEALSKLSALVFPLGCPADTKPEDLAEYINQQLTPERFRVMLEDDRIVILIVTISDELAGYALIARGASHPQGRLSAPCELRKFYIDPAYHGRGVADALMGEVISAVADGCEGALWLSVFSGNQRAISFYQRWGFRICGSQDFYVGTDCQKDYLMQREETVARNEGPQCK
jgi:ribosomal protein S18 acetylase RimI-like enzyme